MFQEIKNQIRKHKDKEPAEKKRKCKLKPLNKKVYNTNLTQI